MYSVSRSAHEAHMEHTRRAHGGNTIHAKFCRFCRFLPVPPVLRRFPPFPGAKNTERTRRAHGASGTQNGCLGVLQRSLAFLRENMDYSPKHIPIKSAWSTAWRGGKKRPTSALKWFTHTRVKVVHVITRYIDVRGTATATPPQSSSDTDSPRGSASRSSRVFSLLPLAHHVLAPCSLPPALPVP